MGDRPRHPGTAEGSLGGAALQTSPADPPGSARALTALTGVGTGPAVVTDGILTLPVHEPGATLTEVVRRLDAAGVHIRGAAVTEPSLDDVFLALTGRAADGPTRPAADASREAA